MLKLREVAKLFHRRELGNGRHISFWLYIWSERGALIDLLGPRGMIEMGVKRDATLEEVVLVVRRRRKHRTRVLNDIEVELYIIASKLVPKKEDSNLWRGKTGFKQKFSTHETWSLLREGKTPVSWARANWFSQATPKFAFMALLSVRDRMSTLDRIAKWS